VVEKAGQRIDASLPGPRNPPGDQQPEYRTSLGIRLLPEGNAIELRVGRERLRLSLRQDSGWVRVVFRRGRGRFGGVSGLCRFRLEALQPHFRLYVSPIHLDPERPAMPISHPLAYSIYLAKLHAPFATLGLAEDTWALNSGAITEEAFLEQAWAIHDERERMLFDALRRMRRGLTVCVFDGPDRIQHMFYRHDVPDHPANTGRDCTRFAGVIDTMYERMDDLVGRVAAELEDDAVLMVLSDHGFCDFSRGVNLNVWLREHGYLFARDDVPPGDYLAGVDWSRTRAYAFGLSGIYLNQAGREAQGIVAPSEAAALRAEIAGKLTGLMDPERHRRAIKTVYDSHAAYHGPYVLHGPDLIVGYERGYRASWENAAGRIDGAMLHDNPRFWSGDHCVDPELVPGVFFANRRLAAGGPASILDLAPTILQLFGAPIPGYMDGRPLSLTRGAPPPAEPAGEPAPRSVSVAAEVVP
jgi:hypothetical protein